MRMLDLFLATTRAPVDVFFVGHVERPSAN
jgi:hypothetical protein